MLIILISVSKCAFLHKETRGEPQTLPIFLEYVDAFGLKAAKVSGGQKSLLGSLTTVPSFLFSRNSIAASAVCVFNLSAISQAFNGPFKYQENSRSVWLPYPNPNPSFQVISGAEGTLGIIL